MSGTLLPTALLAAGGRPDVGALLEATLPEILLSAGLVTILLLGAFLGNRPRLAPRLSFATVVLTLLVVVSPFFSKESGTLAVGPLVVDDMARLFRILFLAAGAYTLLFGMRKSEPWFDQAEFHVLLLGSLAAMSVLSAATDMLTAYLAFEFVSYTGYMMVGYRKGLRESSEAGVKYVIFGSAASGAMLFGITYLFGLAGSTDMGRVAEVLSAEGASPAALAAAVLVFAGVAFKISAAPFHFWAPDAYQGSSAPVAGFLAVASKAAGFAVVVRVVGTWVGTADPVPAGTTFAFLPAGPLPLWILGAGAVATMIVGNAAALRQRELKRLLAWSSVAHAGYILMALSVGGAKAFGGVLFYFWVYMLMTLGGFGIVGLLRSRLGGTEMRHYNGLARRNPLLAVALAVLMISLTGLPPTAGFVGKVLLFMPVIEAKYYGLAVVGLLTSAVSLFYYAGLIRCMFLVPPPEGSEAPVPLEMPDWLLVGVSTAPLLGLFLFGWWSGAAPLLQAAEHWVSASLR